MHIGSELIAEFHQVVSFFFPPPPRSFSLSPAPSNPPPPTSNALAPPPSLPPSPSLHPPCFKKKMELPMAGPCFQQDFFTLQRRGAKGGGREGGKNEWKRQKSSSPGRLLNRLNIPRSHFLPVCFFDNKKKGEERGNLKNSQRFRLTILIADSSGKINSLMSAVVSPIKVLGRRLVRVWGCREGCNL